MAPFVGKTRAKGAKVVVRGPDRMDDAAGTPVPVKIRRRPPAPAGGAIGLSGSEHVSAWAAYAWRARTAQTP
jgi:hypothetical protein